MRFSEEIKSRMEEVVGLFESGDVGRGQRRLAEIALEIADEVESDALSPKDADDHFMYIDVGVEGRGLIHELGLSEDTDQLILEGNLLHDYGETFGADLGVIRELANRIIAGSS